MRVNARLWKFWTWEIALAILMLTLGGVVWLYAPGFVEAWWGRGAAVAAFAILAVSTVTLAAYRLATGSVTGFAKWLGYLLGSGTLVALILLLPLFLSKHFLKPEYTHLTSPFAALFILWCFYWFGFLVQWQTRLFHRLMDQVRGAPNE